MIHRLIDFDQSKSRQRWSVKPGADPQLDDLKHRYDGMGSFLTQVVNHIKKDLPPSTSQHILSCVFLPQLGFLLETDLDPRISNTRHNDQRGEPDIWEKVFVTEETICYKNAYMKELDDRYGDVYSAISGK